MITDIFERRYAAVQIRSRYCEEDRRFFTQAASMITDLMWLGQKSDTVSATSEQNLKEVHDVLAIELGKEFLSDRYWFQSIVQNGNTNRTAHQNSYAVICKNFLKAFPEDLEDSESWIKERISFVELAFQRRMNQIKTINLQLPVLLSMPMIVRNTRKLSEVIVTNSRNIAIQADNDRINASFLKLVNDLNERLRLSRHKLVFHNGLIQLAHDENTDRQVAKPF